MPPHPPLLVPLQKRFTFSTQLHLSFKAKQTLPYTRQSIVTIKGTHSNTVRPGARAGQGTVFCHCVHRKYQHLPLPLPKHRAFREGPHWRTSGLSRKTMSCHYPPIIPPCPPAPQTNDIYKILHVYERKGLRIQWA